VTSASAPNTLVLSLLVVPFHSFLTPFVDAALAMRAKIKNGGDSLLSNRMRLFRNSTRQFRNPLITSIFSPSFGSNRHGAAQNEPDHCKYDVSSVEDATLGISPSSDNDGYCQTEKKNYERHFSPPLNILWPGLAYLVTKVLKKLTTLSLIAPIKKGQGKLQVSHSLAYPSPNVKLVALIDNLCYDGRQFIYTELC